MAPGAYQLVLGPHLQTPAGSSLDQDDDLTASEDPADCYTADFEIASGPWIVGHTPSGDQVQPVSEVRVTFDGPIDNSSIRSNDVVIQGPAGPVNMTVIRRRLAATSIELRFRNRPPMERTMCT